MTQTARPRVLLADDHGGMLKALQRFLASTCEVVGKVSSGAAALEAAMMLKPDVVVLDIAMPGIDGLEACRQIKDAIPQVGVVILTGSLDDDMKQRAFDVGASAFVTKRRIADELLEAVYKAR
jgi:DNA-binding NarL/FixJ family response regulator